MAGEPFEEEGEREHDHRGEHAEEGDELLHGWGRFGRPRMAATGTRREDEGSGDRRAGMRRAAKDGRDEKLELWELHGSKITPPDIGWAG